MKRYTLFLAITWLLFACRLQPDSNRNYDIGKENKVYKLQLKPQPGNTYHFDITNESETELEVDNKTVNNINKTSTGVNYEIAKDSSGNFIFNITYDKVHIYTKNGDIETDADASNAFISSDPVERMLGLLTKARITATIDTLGDVKNMTGYKELGERILSGFSTDDPGSTSLAQAQWEKMIGNGMIKRNMNQFLKIFPDSSVHVGDSWKLSSREEGEIPVNVKGIFTLKTINNDIAIVNSEGTMTSDNVPSTLMGYSGVVADLKGTQEGRFEVETKTGMLVNCTIRTGMKGSIEIMGREIPVAVKGLIKIKGMKK